MSEQFRGEGTRTTSSQDYFQTMFDNYDSFASFWQPAFRGCGRWQLEMAQLAARQSRLTIDVSRNLAMCFSPADAVREGLIYLEKSAANYAGVADRLSEAAVAAVQPAGLVLSVLPFPEKKVRDTMDLPTVADEAARPQRRVA